MLVSNTILEMLDELVKASNLPKAKKRQYAEAISEAQKGNEKFYDELVKWQEKYGKIMPDNLPKIDPHDIECTLTDN
jgi:hypothetical protein